eukprot:4166045-Amphidinium_carterae.1
MVRKKQRRNLHSRGSLSFQGWSFLQNGSCIPDPQNYGNAFACVNLFKPQLWAKRSKLPESINSKSSTHPFLCRLKDALCKYYGCQHQLLRYVQSYSSQN